MRDHNHSHHQHNQVGQKCELCGMIAMKTVKDQFGVTHCYCDHHAMHDKYAGKTTDNGSSWNKIR